MHASATPRSRDAGRLAKRGAGGRAARDAVAVALAICVGVHAGLAPAHLYESAVLGASFILVALGCSLLVLAVTSRPAQAWPLRATALVLSALAIAYVASRTVGIPVLVPRPEIVDPIGVATACVEAGGAALAIYSSRLVGTAAAAARPFPGTFDRNLCPAHNERNPR